MAEAMAMADMSAMAALVALPVGAVATAVPLCHAAAQWEHSHGHCRLGSMAMLRWWAAYTACLVLLVVGAMAAAVACSFFKELPSGYSSLQISSTCRVLSKRVDLKTAKLCMSPFTSVESTKRSRAGGRGLHCYFEYYWASVFEVEFWPSASPLPFQGAVEEPSALLPAHCRPGFRAAWKVKEHYKINGTYPCKYNPTALHLVRLVEEDRLYSGCREANPSTSEQLGLFFFQLLHSERSIFSISTKNGQLLWGLIGGICQGVSLSILIHFSTKSAYLRWRARDHLSNERSGQSKYSEWILFHVRTQGAMMLLWVLTTLAFISVWQGDLSGAKDDWEASVFVKEFLKFLG